MFLVLQLPLRNPLKPGVENEDVVGAAPIGDAPTSSEWLTILLPTKGHQILEVWVYYVSAWVSDNIYYTVWDEITYPFSNFNGTTVEV